MLELMHCGENLKQWTAAGFHRLLWCWVDDEIEEYCNYPEAFAGVGPALSGIRYSGDRCGVYVLYFRNSGKFYIGSTYYLQVRSRTHLYFLKANKHYNQKLQCEYDRRRALPDVIYLFTNTEGEARTVEQRLVDLLFNDPYCVNQRHMVEEYRPAHEDTRKKLSDAAKAQWQDPDFRSKIKDIYADPAVKARRVETGKRLAADPEYLKKLSSATKRLWEDPEYAANQKKSGAATWEIEGFRERHGAAMRAKWADPDYKASVRGKIDAAIARSRKPLVIDGVTYSHARAAALALGISESTARRLAADFV